MRRIYRTAMPPSLYSGVLDAMRRSILEQLATPSSSSTWPACRTLSSAHANRLPHCSMPAREKSCLRGGRRATTSGFRHPARGCAAAGIAINFDHRAPRRPQACTAFERGRERSHLRAVASRGLLVRSCSRPALRSHTTHQPHDGEP